MCDTKRKPIHTVFWTYSDALRVELLRSLGGGLDDSRVVTTAETSVTGDL